MRRRESMSRFISLSSTNRTFAIAALVIIYAFALTAARTGRRRTASLMAATISRRDAPPFSITLRACPNRRSRSAAVSCFAVMTMTGISRHCACAASASSTSKPSISGIIRSSKITAGIGCSPTQGLNAVVGLGDRQAHLFDGLADHLARAGIVFDHQDGTFAAHQVVDQGRQLRAFDRLGQHLDGAER